MYKIYNYLFGWDYIQWSNTCDFGIARVHVLPDGKVVFWQYRGISVLQQIVNSHDVYWLTCLPSKYGL